MDGTFLEGKLSPHSTRQIAGGEKMVFFNPKLDRVLLGLLLGKCFNFVKSNLCKVFVEFKLEKSQYKAITLVPVL